MATVISSPLVTRPLAWASRLEAAAFTGLLVALLWAPWPLGSNRPWALAVLAGLLWVSLLLAAAGAWGTPRLSGRWAPVWRGGRAVATAWLPTGCLVVFALLVVAQLLPGLGAGGGTLTIQPFVTKYYLLTTLTYLGAWLLILLTVHSRERAAWLLATLVAAGVLQALAAVLLFSGGATYDYLFTRFSQGVRAMGSYPNPDHLAGYMALCLSAGLGWLLSQFARPGERPVARHWQARTVAVLTFLMSGKMLLRLVLVVMVIALVMTHSRMGNGAFFLALALTGGVVAWRSRQLRRPALWLVLSMAVVDVFIIGQWVGLDRVVERMKNTAEASSATVASFGLGAAPPPREESLAQRLEVPRLSLQLVASRPWFGHGGGTYITAFPPFKTAGLPWQWDHAHNDYVEVACDMGLVGLALWMTVGAASAWRAARLLHDRETRVNRGVGVAAIMALCCMALHSLVDFNLHIPANALTFTALLAAVWAVPPALIRRGSRRSA